MWEYSRVLACSFAWETTMQESDCLEQGLWHGPICFMVLASRRANLRHNLGKVWGVLQATIKWGESPLWPSSQALNKATRVWVNGIMQCKLKSTQQIPHRNNQNLAQRIIWLFLHDEKFVCRTISDGNVDLDKFSASKVWQLAERMGSSKDTAWHINK